MDQGGDRWTIGPAGELRIQGVITVGYIQYAENSVMGTNLITIANSGAARCHGNVSANGFVAVTAS